MVNPNMKYTVIFACLLALLAVGPASAQDKKPTEDDYYRMLTFPLPKEIVLEVGGLGWLDKAKNRLLVCTRRGEVWMVDNPYADPPMLESAEANAKGDKPENVDPSQLVSYKRMLFGLHEPLGILVQDDGIYMAQRSEVTRINDTNGDDRIDLVETFSNGWEISGSYHEYAFGPKLDGQGNMWVTLNRPFGGEPEGKALWRGWAVIIDKKGEMHPVCPGLRSPAGLGTNCAGDMFYTDNQGDWVAACKLSHLKPNTFQGNPLSLASCDHPKSTFKHPGKGMPPNGLKMHEAKQKMPSLLLPAVWFPYPEMGKSHSDVLCDDTGGKFGPFAKQVFVGDQSRSIVVRVFLEKVDGEYQGACFPFRQGFQCGVMRMCWGKDGSMFVGETNRGWGSTGGKPYGLQRLVWTGQVPFEIHEMRAQPDGFELTFTHPVDPKTAGDVKSYTAKCWTYFYHSKYGCPPVDTHALKVTKATVGKDNKSVRLVIEGLQPGYVQEVRAPGLRSQDGLPLLHPVGYYTLNSIPK